MSNSLINLIAAGLVALAMVFFWRVVLFVALVAVLTLLVYGVIMVEESFNAPYAQASLSLIQA